MNIAYERKTIEQFEEMEEFKERIQQETVDSLIKTIKVSDSYFYAEMNVFKAYEPHTMSNKVKCITKINLYNSEEFQHPNMTNQLSMNLKGLKSKEIISETELDADRLIYDRRDLMKIVYDAVAKQIAHDLMVQNFNNIHMAVENKFDYSKKTYIQK